MIDMPKKRRSTKGLRKGSGLFGNKMVLAVLIGTIVMVGGFTAFYMMSGRDSATWDSATQVMRDRGISTLPDTTETVTTTTAEINETELMAMVNPVNMRVFGIDGEGTRHEVVEAAVVAESAFIGDIEIFDVEFDIAWDLTLYLGYNSQFFAESRTVQVFISIVDSAVFDTYGNSYIDETPVVFEYNVTVNADSLGNLIGFVTFSMVNDLYGAIVTSIDDIDNLIFDMARANGALINQEAIVNEDGTTTINELTGMLTFEYGVLGFYMVDGLGSDANRALKRLTVTTEPVAPETGEVPPASAFSVYSIGGYNIEDTVLIMGMGVFVMILVFVYLGRRR